MNKKQLTQTGAGWGALIALAGGVLNSLMDGNPATNPDWNLVIPAAITAIGVITARAKKATSEDVGAKTPEMPGK